VIVKGPLGENRHLATVLVVVVLSDDVTFEAMAVVVVVVFVAPVMAVEAAIERKIVESILEFLLPTDATGQRKSAKGKCEITVCILGVRQCPKDVQQVWIASFQSVEIPIHIQLCSPQAQLFGLGETEAGILYPMISEGADHVDVIVRVGCKRSL